MLKPSQMIIEQFLSGWHHQSHSQQRRWWGCAAGIIAAVANSLDKILDRAVGVISVFASLLNKIVGWAAGVIDTVASLLIASIRQKWSISKHRVGQVGWI